MSEISTELLQAILLNNLTNILDFHKNEDRGIVDTLFGKNYGKEYKNLITINNDSSSTNIGKMLALPDSVVACFNRMTPLERSFLYPTINIYRMNKSGDYTEVRLRNHFDDLQLDLLDNTPSKEYLWTGTGEKATKAENVILNSNEAFSVGLKSIYIEDRPEREGDVNISVKITYLFENILALLQQQVVDLIKTPLVKDETNILDFRLKLVIGWSIPQDFSLNPAVDEIFKNAMEYSETIYLLQIVQHNLTFNENGSIALNIEYSAAIEGYFDSNSADLLNIDNLLKGRAGLGYTKQSDQLKNSRIIEYTKNYIEIQKAEKQLETITQDPTKTEDKEVEKLQKKIGELKEENIKYAKYLRKVRYGWILKSLYENNQIYVLEMPEEFLTKFSDVSSSTAEDDKQVENDKILLNALKQFFKLPYSIGKIKRIGSLQVSGIEPLLKTDASESDDLQTKTNEDIEDVDKDGIKLSVKGEEVKTTQNSYSLGDLLFKRLKTSNNETDSKLNPKQKPIYYIRLGDLFDTVAGFIEKYEEYNIIFGTIEYFDYRTNKVQSISITDIPISLEQFNIWFINTVIKPQLEVYNFKTFIEDVLRTLVSPLFGFFYDGIQSPISVVTFNSQIITSTVQIKEKTITADKLKGLLVDKNKKEKIFYQYYVIYCSILENKDLKGDLKEDTDKGIYHYQIGSSAGVLTKADFVKIDNQKLRDARLVSQNLNTAGAILREHYNCDLTVVGNPLFHNGRLFYTDGSYLGDIGRQATESIGLGGYYLTHGINHTFEDGNWKMKITGIFLSPRYGAYGNPVGGQINPGSVKNVTTTKLDSVEPNRQLNPSIKERTPTAVGRGSL